MKRRGLPPIDPAIRFERFVERVPESGCWIWTGATASRYKYGVLRVGSLTDGTRAQRYAHQIAWESRNGPIPVGMKVLHRCDVHCCVNPAHLFLGTQAENLQDMRSKGRGAKGERHGIAKLTERAVLLIRSSSECNAVLASRFGVTRSAVQMARSRQTWRHLP